MNTFTRIRGIVFALFGSYILLFGLFVFGRDLFHGLSSGVWRFIPFGEGIGDPHPRLPPGIGQWIFGTIWAAPYALVALVIGGGLLWQGLRTIAYPE
jgi:hypothetical protein